MEIMGKMSAILLLVCFAAFTTAYDVVGTVVCY